MDYFEGEYDFKARMTSNVKMITSKVDLRYGLLRVWVRNQGEDDFERGWFKVRIILSVKMIPSKVDLKVWITSSLSMISSVKMTSRWGWFKVWIISSANMIIGRVWLLMWRWFQVKLISRYGFLRAWGWNEGEDDLRYRLLWVWR